MTTHSQLHLEILLNAHTRTSPKCHLILHVKEGIWVHNKQLYYAFKFLDNVDYDNNKFIHVRTYICNKIIQLFKLAGVAQLK